MGDYLKLVADRSQGKVGAIQPRVPSLFEPPAASMSARFTPFQSLSNRVVQEHADTEYSEPTRASTWEAQPHIPSGNLHNRREPSPVSEIADRPAKRETIKPNNESLRPESERPTAQALKTSAEREIERVVSRVEPTPLQPKPKTISRAEDGATEQTDESLLKPRPRRTAQEEKRGDEGDRFNVSSRRLDATIQPRAELANRPMPQPIAPVHENLPFWFFSAICMAATVATHCNSRLYRFGANAVQTAVCLLAPKCPTLHRNYHLPNTTRGGCANAWYNASTCSPVVSPSCSQTR